MALRTNYLMIALVFCTACQKAVKAPEEAVYIIKGNKSSLLYPTEVKQNNEDVLITLKPDAPLPDITSLDKAENKIEFRFSLVQNTIVVPGKFVHLRLSHDKDESIDILRKDSE